jgi:ABC-2 type transport system permease protein
MSTLSTFVFVTVRSFKNRILQRIRRLKQPRYLISALAGLVYFWFMFLRRIQGMSAAKHLPLAWPINDMLLSVASAVLLCLGILVWALPDDSGGIQFTPAEIQFLFPAPLARWQLLLYKLTRSQAQILTSTLIFYILGARRGFFVGVWLAMTAANLYLIAVAFGRARLKLMGIGWFKRLIAVLLVLGGFFMLLRSIYVHEAGIGSSRKELFAAVLAPLHRAPLSVLLFVPRLLASAAFPADPLTFATSCAGLIVFGALMFLFASRVQVAFEEASIVKSQKVVDRANRMQQQRGGRSIVFRRAKPLFRLQPVGMPEVAIFWKNLTAAVRTSVATVVIAVIGSLAMFGVGMTVKNPDVFHVLGMMMLCMAGLFAFLGPFTLRNDLRFDLPKLEILKSYPLRGDRIVAAEIAAPLAIAVAIDLLLLFGGSIMLQMGSPPKGQLLFFLSPEFIVVALMFIVPMTAIQLLIQNAIVIFFPAWVTTSKEEMRGFAASGQRMVMLLGHLLSFGITLLPAAIVFVPSFFIAQKIMPDSSGALALSTVPAFALLVFEIVIAIRFLGDQFDKIDLSKDLDALASESA